ncbi:MAG TPA: transporter substrate-binding domain-containing protein [Candidatus Limnocylindrales bacterium]|nr:transporter substrate-binding domain-containing protein [Candidatus Limnocylindrales bacterium]
MQHNRLTAVGWFTVAVISATVSSLVAYGLVRNVAAGVPVGEEIDAYSAIRERGVLRASYYVGAPYFVLEPNTLKRSGIFYEVLEAVGAKLGLAVNWNEEVGFGDMAEGLRRGRYDVVGSGVWISADRGRHADFTVPVVFDVVSAYARTDDHRFDGDIDKANDSSITVATIDGEMAQTIAKIVLPSAHIASLPQLTEFSQMIEEVISGKADLTFLGLAAARRYQAKNPGKIRNVLPDRPVRVFPTAIMLPPDQWRLKRVLDLALGEMLDNGEIDRIVSKYEEVAGSHYRVAAPYRAPADGEDVPVSR